MYTSRVLIFENGTLFIDKDGGATLVVKDDDLAWDDKTRVFRIDAAELAQIRNFLDRFFEESMLVEALR